MRQRNVSIIVLEVFLLVCIGMVCTLPTNPYLKPQRGSLLFTGMPVAQGDTVKIFSTFSFTFDVKLAEDIDSVELRCANNRLWHGGDTVFPGEALKRAPFSLSVSIGDTGRQKLVATIRHIGGESDSQTIAFFASSPLIQSPVSARLGDTIVLSTPPVADNVLYVWNFRNGTVIRNDTNVAKLVVRTPLSAGVGELYVSDRSHRSPSALYTIRAPKSENLLITPLADSMSGDTICTGDVNYTFRVQASGAGDIIAASVNGRPFDRSIRQNDGSFIFSRLFSGINVQTGLVQALVSITDNTGAVAGHTFWLRFSPSGPRSDCPTLHFVLPSADSTTVGASSYPIRGYASNRTGFDSLTAFVYRNDSLRPDYRQFFTDSVWQWTINLAAGWNRIAVMAFEDPSRQGDTLATVTRFVKYSPGAPDSTPPIILSLLGSGKPLFDGLIVADSILSVQAEILDASGLAAVSINDRALPVNAATAVYATPVVLLHRLSGSTIHVHAVDSAGNSSDSTVTVYVDKAPVFARLPQTARISADSLYTAIIGVSDADNDPVSLSVTIHGPRGDTLIVLGEARTLSWQPAAADTGWRTVDVRAWDGYQAADTSCLLYVSPANTQGIPVRFLTTPSDIPDSIMASIDTMRINLQADPASGTPPLRFSASVKNGPVLLDNSTSGMLLWAPAEADTGIRTFQAVVRDSRGFADTVTAFITVVPPQRVSASFDKTGSSGLELISSRAIAVRLSPAPRKTISVAYAVDWAKTPADRGDFALPPVRNLLFGAGDTLETIPLTIINDGLSENDEKVVLSLTGTSAGTESVTNC